MGSVLSKAKQALSPEPDSSMEVNTKRSREEKSSSSSSPPLPPKAAKQQAPNITVGREVPLLTPGRKQRIEFFLSRAHLDPKDFGDCEPWGDTWISQLIVALAEPQEDAVTPEDVRAWKVEHVSLFKTTQQKIVEPHEGPPSQASAGDTAEVKVNIVPPEPKSPVPVANRFAGHRKVAGHPVVSPREYLEAVTTNPSYPEPMVAMECNNHFQIVGEFDQHAFMQLAAYLLRKGVVKPESLPFTPPPFL